MRKILIASALLAIAPALFGSLYTRTHSGALINMYGISNAYAYEQDQAEINRKCQEWWNGVWQLAKGGDLEVIRQINPTISLHRSIGRKNNDFLLQKREAIIWAIHPLRPNTQTARFPQRGLDALFGDQSSPLRKAIIGTQFERCMLEKYNQDCVPLAVEEGIVPSFADYAKELDEALQNNTAWAVCGR